MKYRIVEYKQWYVVWIKRYWWTSWSEMVDPHWLHNSPEEAWQMAYDKYSKHIHHRGKTIIAEGDFNEEG